MLFGAKEIFAVEAMTEPDLEVPSAVWGRLRIWCRNESFGDYENPYNALHSAAECFREMLDAYPDLWDSTFDLVEDAERFRLFNEAIYIGSHSDTDQIVDLADRYWKFDFLTNWGEHTNGIKGLLAFDPNGEVLFMVEDRDELVRAFRFPQTCFTKTAADFVEWFDSEAERLQNKTGEQAASSNH
jgi:hypothetical protein